ncbi:helix-turn-helix domain-containing protein [Pedococcus sp. P5_B7]
MRLADVQHATTTESEDLLTTGEVARLLSSSRQHVVDLCNSGELPFQTVGRHRRIRRRDVEALRNRTLRPSRDQRRSQWLNMAVAGKLVAEPDQVLALARENLERLQRKHSRGQGAYWLSQWQEVLEGPVDQVLNVLTSPTPWAREMRQNSPFAGVLSDEERTKVLEAFRDTDRSSR